MNLSLSALKECLRTRVRHSLHAFESGAGSFRKSTLTRLLKNPLSMAKIFFLACCSPAHSSSSTTLETLRYASMVKFIKTRAEDNALLSEQGMDNTPVKFLPLSKLQNHDGIPRSDKNLTVHLCELRVSIVRVMISHRWLRPRKKLPDSEGNPKHKLLCVLFKRLCKQGWIRDYCDLQIVTWLDFGEWQSFFPVAKFFPTCNSLYFIPALCERIIKLTMTDCSLHQSRQWQSW